MAVTKKSKGELEKLVKSLQAEVLLLQSKINSFFTGDVPPNCTLDHMILAKYGRQRLTEKAKTAVLLSKTTSH